MSSELSRLQEVIGSATLPTLPAVAMEVLSLCRRDDVIVDELAAAMHTDQALTTKVLRTVNSSYYGLKQRCATIQRAVSFLGLKATRTIALSFTLADSIDGGHGDDDIAFDFVTYWRRAVYSAAAARRIALLTRAADPEDAYLAALVQDIGMVVLHRSRGERYLQVIDVAGADHRRLIDVEHRSFGVDHAQAGAMLAEHWRLPDFLADSIRHHHAPEGAPAAIAPLATIVFTGTLASLCLSLEDAGTVIGDYLRTAHRALGISSPDASNLLADTASDAVELSRLLDVRTGGRAEIERILAEARRLLDGGPIAQAA